MNTINTEQIAKLLSKKIGEDVVITAIEPAGSGFHSDGFKLSTKNGKRYFLKRVKSIQGGFEFPERKIQSLLVSDSMARRTELAPQPIGVVVKNGHHSGIAMEITEMSEVYHIQEFETFTESYLDRFNTKQNKWKPDEKDLEEIDAVVAFAVQLHSVKHPTANKQERQAIYRDGIKSVLTHPELTFALLEDFPEDHPFLSAEKQAAHINRMLQNIYRFKNCHNRLCALHGDFWGANVFFREDNSIGVIDYSRIPWGDPGIDIGWWLSPYLWQYHLTGNSYYKELGEEFIKRYETASGDGFIRNAMSLAMGFIGIVNMYPKFYPAGIDLRVQASFFAAITESLEKGVFVWDAESIDKK